MLKLIFCLHRLPSLSREEFQRYWWETHGPLVRRHAAALGIRHYVQSHALGGDLDAALLASRGGPPGYDGVAELWWDDAASFAAASASEAGRIASRELLEDERRFIDHSRSPLFVVEEREPLA
ncbi:MAG: EthD domain-containing protein [Deltaproteobacteria bacterium]|nr:EthD domain-containing protein [Deltaproteobacteria bacterium]